METILSNPIALAVAGGAVIGALALANNCKGGRGREEATDADLEYVT